MINFSAVSNTSSPWFWLMWSGALVWQNYSFTRVSRARNSASLKAHAIASLQSNSAWFLQSLFVYSSFMTILTGHAGLWKAIGAGLFYTALTMTGSVYAHYVSLKKESGKTAVGANKKYAQIAVEDYTKMRLLLTHYEVNVKDEFEQVKKLAETSYQVMVGVIPDSKITATKVAGQTVTTGVPENNSKS
jgi:hypothetical protein